MLFNLCDDQAVIWFYTRCGGSLNVYGVHHSQGHCHGMDWGIRFIVIELSIYLSWVGIGDLSHVVHNALGMNYMACEQ